MSFHWRTNWLRVAGIEKVHLKAGACLMRSSLPTWLWLCKCCKWAKEHKGEGGGRLTQFVCAACKWILGGVNTAQYDAAKGKQSSLAKFKFTLQSIHEVPAHHRFPGRWQINPLLGRQVARKLQFTLTHQPHHSPPFAGHKLGKSWAKACQSHAKKKKRRKVREKRRKVFDLNKETRSTGKEHASTLSALSAASH